MCYDMYMELCLINIGNIKLSAAEIDVIHLLLEDDDPPVSYTHLTLPTSRAV